MLKPQDIVIALKVSAIGDRSWSQGGLARELSMSPSEINSGLKRCVKSGLMRQLDDGKYHLVKAALEEFLIHGLKYVFPVERGEQTKGSPTANAGPAFSQLIKASGDSGEEGFSPTLVWPDPEGAVTGYALKPLYHTVTKAVKHDEKLYRLLSLTDMMRYGECSEMRLAEKLLVAEL